MMGQALRPILRSAMLNCQLPTTVMTSGVLRPRLCRLPSSPQHDIFAASYSAHRDLAWL